MADEIKTAEHRGYARGYVAGRKKAKQERSADNLHKERQAFLDKAFLACLPFAAAQSGWKHGEKPITGIRDRVSLAADFAKEALKQRPWL